MARSPAPAPPRPTASALATDGPQIPDRIYERRWLTLAVLCLSLVMIVVANWSLNVALPSLQTDLQIGPSGLQWIVDAYSLVFAGLLLTAGALGDRYGRRLALNCGLIIFGVASGLAALSHSSAQLVATRAVMGLGAALVMPSTLSVLAHVFPPEERPRAVAIWAGMAGVGTALGGLISGFLLQRYWWGSIFLTNVAVVTVALVAGAALVPSSRDERERRLDPVGALLSITGLVALVYTIIEAPTRGWTSLPTMVSLAVAITLLSAFARWELRATEPMLDLRFFRNPRFTAAASTITLVFFVMFGTIFLLTQYLQSVLGYSTFQAGARIVPMGAAYLLAAPLSARLVQRLGQRRVVSGGLLVVAAGLGLLARNGLNADYPLLALALGVLGAGMGLVTAPSTGAIVASLPLDRAGVGSAVNDTTRELGGALGVAVIGSSMASMYRGSVLPHLAALPAAAQAADVSLGATLQSAASLPVASARALDAAARQAYVHGFHVTLVACVGVALFAAGLVAWLLRPRPSMTAQTTPDRADGSVPGERSQPGYSGV